MRNPTGVGGVTAETLLIGSMDTMNPEMIMRSAMDRCVDERSIGGRLMVGVGWDGMEYWSVGRLECWKVGMEFFRCYLLYLISHILSRYSPGGGSEAIRPSYSMMRDLSL